MSKLVIAEKPMLAHDIARAITGKEGVRKRPPSHLGKRLHGLCLRRPPFWNW